MARVRLPSIVIVVAASLLAVACRSATPPLPAQRRPPAPCIADEVEATRRQGHRDPVGFVVDRLADHQVVMIGEHHRLPREIDFVVEAVRGAAARGLEFDVAMELVPAHRQRELDAALLASRFDEELWVQIIGDSYLAGPQTMLDYREIFRAVWEANRGASKPRRLVALQPDCRFATVGDKQGYDACDGGRDAFMAARLTAEVLSRGRRALVSCGSRHAAVHYQSEQWGVVENLATLVDAAAPASVYTVLLHGPELIVASDDQGSVWSSACGGLFELILDGVGGPFVVELTRPPFDRLSLACTFLGPWAVAGSPLGRAWHAYAVVGPATPLRAPRPLGEAELALVDDADIDQWNRFIVDVIGRPMERPRDRSWYASVGREEARAYGTYRTAPADYCADPAKYRL